MPTRRGPSGSDVGISDLNRVVPAHVIAGHDSPFTPAGDARSRAPGRARTCLIETGGGVAAVVVASKVAGRWAPYVPASLRVGFLSNCLPTGFLRRGVARKTQEHIRPESGVPTSVSPPRKASAHDHHHWNRPSQGLPRRCRDRQQRSRPRRDPSAIVLYPNRPSARVGSTSERGRSSPPTASAASSRSSSSLPAKT